jgi:hypothetical protein
LGALDTYHDNVVGALLGVRPEGEKTAVVLGAEELDRTLVVERRAGIAAAESLRARLLQERLRYKDEERGGRVDVGDYVVCVGGWVGRCV